jgi:hypothetical protein
MNNNCIGGGKGKYIEFIFRIMVWWYLQWITTDIGLNCVLIRYRLADLLVRDDEQYRRELADLQETSQEKALRMIGHARQLKEVRFKYSQWGITIPKLLINVPVTF